MATTERSLMQAILDNPRSNDEERAVARRRIEQIDREDWERRNPPRKPEPPAPAPVAAAPAPVDVTPRRTPTEADERLAAAQRADNAKWVARVVANADPNEMSRHRREALAGIVGDIAVAAQVAPEPTKRSPESEEGREVLRKSGRQLIANFETQQARAFQSMVMVLGNGSAMVRPAREHEFAVRAAAQQLIQWFKSCGDVTKEGEFQAGKTKLIDYLRKERDDQLAAAPVDRVMDITMALREAEAASPKRNTQATDTAGFDPDRCFHPQR